MKQRYKISKRGETVFDSQTGLEWQREVAPGSKIWEEAQAYARRLKLAGEKPWRLPTVQELVSIVDYSRRKPAIDTKTFPGTPPEWFWTLTQSAGSSACVWFVSFFVGIVGYGVTSYGFRIRCVR